MIFAIIAVSIALIYMIISYVFMRIIFIRFTPRFDPMKKLDEELERSLEPYKSVTKAGAERMTSQPFEEVSIVSHDGLTLKGSYYENPSAKAVLVGMHGYRSGFLRDFAGAFDFYYDLGFSLLLVDQRATGRSEGKYITFGIKESRDACDWCRYVQKRFPQMPAALAGISLGASSTLMAADGLPDNVKILLADCGFNDPKKEILFVAKNNVPGGFLFLPGVELLCRIFGKFSLNGRTAAESLKNCRLPVFLAHGENDKLVSPENIHIIGSACKGPVVMMTFPGAEHGTSFLTDPQRYKKAIEDFTNKYLFN